MGVHKLIASCLGIGYIKGGGTITAAIWCAIWYGTRAAVSFEIKGFLFTMLVLVMGIWSANRVEKHWGKDSSRVVIDEAAGMGISLLLLPVEWKYLLTAFVLFRFFDILKPLYIRKLESFPGGWGVMLDDVLAGLYTNLLLHIIVWYHIY